jgi:hypothetical protein
MAYAASGTLTGGAVTTVTVTATADGVEVINRTQTGEIWVRLDGTDPTVAGADCFVVLGARLFPARNGLVTVKLIASSALAYAVEGLVIVA